VLCLCLPLAIAEAEAGTAASGRKEGWVVLGVREGRARLDVGLTFPRAEVVRLGLPLVTEGLVGWEGAGLAMALHPGGLRGPPGCCFAGRRAGTFR